MNRPQPSERISINGTSFSEIWLRCFWGLVDRVSGTLPPQLPIVYVNPTGTQRGLPTATEDGLVLIVADEVGGRTIATSYNSQWRRVSDGAVVS